MDILEKLFKILTEEKESITAFESAISLARDIGSKEHLLKCLRLQSITYKEWNNLSEFLRLSEEALKLAVELKHKIEEAKCANNIGYCNLL